MLEISVLIGLGTATLVALLFRDLATAARNPTPAGSLLLISVLYVMGAMVVQWRDGSLAAAFVYCAYVVHFAMYLVGFYTLSAALRLRRVPPNPQPDFHRSTSLAVVGTWVFFVLLLGTSIVWIHSVGADSLLQALVQFVFLGNVDVSILDLRLSMVSGEEGWLAPGYLKQVRDVLLPLGTLLVLYSLRRKAAYFLLLTFALIPLVSALMISSGQRAPVLLFLIGAVYAAKNSVAWRMQSRLTASIPIVVVTILGFGTFFALTSSFSSRYDDDASVLLILADRVMTRLPEENILSVSAWSRGAPFMGAGWLSEIASVLPGTQRGLSAELHMHLGGGERGNSPLGAWVDLHYNFGWSLGIAVALVVGFFMAVFNHWVNVNRSASRAADICGLWLSICMFLVLSPFGFLLYGPFILSICLLTIVVARSIGSWLRRIAGPASLNQEAA